jgi:hypothetical protein
MMGMRMPETCWAVFKWQVMNLRICCICLVDSVESMMMYGLANPKFFQQYSICMATDVAHTCAGEFWTAVFLFMSHSTSRTHLTRVHASQVQCCGWLQPWLEVQPDILFTNQAQYTKRVIGNNNSHASPLVNTHEVAQCYLQHQIWAKSWPDNKLSVDI